MRNSSDTLDASLRSLTLDASLRSLTRDASDEQDILIFSESWDRILEIGRVVQDGRVRKHSEASSVSHVTRVSRAGRPGTSLVILLVLPSCLA